MTPFDLGRLPRIRFGPGRIEALPQVLAGHGRRVLLVTGARSFVEGPRWAWLTAALEGAGMAWRHLAVAGEPSPELVDAAVRRHAGDGIEVVAGIGGGSALDAAKAVAGLLRVQRPVTDFLEGVGPEHPYPGPALPFVAVPTTAGTGSEATRNAVLSVVGPQGYKKSFRDEALVARDAIVDPDLLATCPPEVIAANGMDALTQLLESFTSLRAHPVAAALARDGLAAVRDGLLPWHRAAREGRDAPEARARMAYAALLSGICLAHTGLGAVHGLASPLGAFHPVPHGVACGTVVAAATRANLAALHARAPDSPALALYAEAARILCGRDFAGDTAAHEALVALLDAWREALALPGLGRYGVGAADIPRIVAHARGSSMRTNPVVLTDEELAAILEACL
ncbi:iron-containing alcohol dehydrogenase [Inmirania thermothiophila]|uniref:Alcohol dehydrogenase n=1 Tax=Inmirania thermothiophila TaxID=1750597 RepID=A0A3N1Y6P0_9GAMM|nr:iron-containing alcohol dehydrogenase [Inmirania thermothiophila]ROR34445.1 alcohol dehydrogenase [Inmirania thermothiophila]